MKKYWKEKIGNPNLFTGLHQKLNVRLMRDVIKLHIKKNLGFTLLELTAVLAIIGILAAIAIPNFRSYQLRAYRTEAQVILGSIAANQMQYKLTSGVFVACPINPQRTGEAWNTDLPEWNRIGFKLSGKLYYQYEVIADPTGFVAYARANLDSDPALDEWEISSKNLTVNNTLDDLK